MSGIYTINEPIARMPWWVGVVCIIACVAIYYFLFKHMAKYEGKTK